jgi:hypothetical protein
MRYGMHHLQATVTMCFLNIWDNIPMDLKYVSQQYFTCMCFLGFIWYNKTFMRVQEIWKFIHPRVSYSPRALPSVNMILLGEYIFIFPSPACNKCQQPGNIIFRYFYLPNDKWCNKFKTHFVTHQYFSENDDT